MKKIVSDCLQNCFNYLEYEEILNQIRSDSPSLNSLSEEQSDSVSFEKNENQFDETISITKDTIGKINSFKNKYTWLVITEKWCIDTRQLIPICNKMAAFSENIELKIAFLEKDTIWIHNTVDEIQIFPTLIILNKNDNSKMLAEWGPRPKGATDLLKSRMKKSGKIPTSAFEEMKMWYFQNKGVSTQFELMRLMNSIELGSLEGI
jgi:hypothetical protein